MVKVTGGGRSVRSVAAHIAYIGHYGEVELESDRGERIREDAQEEFLRTWHLEVSAGQYRSKLPAQSVASGIKLVHNVVLAMPAGTPPDKVLAAARAFARDKFSAHRYVLALHTHQRKRVVPLSITHKFGSHLETDLDIGEARHAAPDDCIAWRRITGAVEVTTEAGEL